MIKNEILEAIDNISNEEFSIRNDINFTIANFYNKQQTILEYCDDITSDTFEPALYGLPYVMESSKEDNPKGKNILQKIWNVIKQFFVMLMTQVRLFIDRIKNRTSKSGNKSFVSCDSVVLRVLSRSKNNVPDDTSTWSIPKINPKYVVGNNKYSTDKEVENLEKEEAKQTRTFTEAATGDKYVTINIPVGKGSTVYPKTVRVPTTDIIAEINDDEKSISFHLKGFGKWSSTRAVTSSSESSGKTDIEGLKKPWTHSAHIALYLISEPSKFDKLIALTDLATEILFSGKKSHIHIFNKRCKSIIDELNRGKKHKKLESVKVSMKDLSNFQQKLNDLNYKLDKFANINCDVSSLDKTTIKNFNLLSKVLLDIQVSMNMLSSSLENNIIVNQCFVGCIKSLALLDQFVASCIDEGMPPKYIAYNTWLVADECIKGKGDQYKPIWGQSRFIFFPPGDRFVYKIAMSGLGITSNKAEIRTSDMFVKMDRVDLIAPVVKSWERDTIVAMERIHSTGDVSYPECGVYTKMVNSAISEYEQKHRVKLNIAISDQHKDNVKFDSINKCYRSIDYGIAKRSS